MFPIFFCSHQVDPIILQIPLSVLIFGMMVIAISYFMFSMPIRSEYIPMRMEDVKIKKEPLEKVPEKKEEEEEEEEVTVVE